MHTHSLSSRKSCQERERERKIVQFDICLHTLKRLRSRSVSDADASIKWQFPIELNLQFGLSYIWIYSPRVSTTRWRQFSSISFRIHSSLTLNFCVDQTPLNWIRIGFASVWGEAKRRREDNVSERNVMYGSQCSHSITHTRLALKTKINMQKMNTWNRTHK